MLETLYEVQTRDLALDALEVEKGATPEALMLLKEQIETLKGVLNKTQERFEALRAEVRAGELELKALDERRKGASRMALEAASSKEASQYQNQEMQFLTRYQELEEDTLPRLEQLERLEGEVNALQGELGELEPKFAADIAEEEARVAQVEARTAELRRERDGVAAEVDAPLLKQYEQVRKARRGVGLVEVVDGQRCGGCSVRLPIHVIQKAKAAKGVTRCPSCGRLLWLKEVA